MSNNYYIKYFLIGDLETGKSITEYTTNVFGSSEKKTSGKIFQKICKSEKKNFEDRNIIASKGNKYYFVTYPPNFVFIAYVDDSYPERLVFGMYDEVRSEDILSMINEGTKELNPNGRQKLKQIIEKYQEKDKLGLIQDDVEEVKEDMKKNIDKMVQNVDDVEKLDLKANRLREASFIYKNSSNEIKMLTLWQNYKLIIIILIVIIILLIIIIIAAAS